MSRQKSLIEIHLATVLFGLAGLFGKWLAFSPLLIVAGRVVFASAALGILLLSLKQSFQARPRHDYFLFFFLGFILAVHWVSFFKSIQVSTVAVGLLSYSSFPVFTAFLEPLFFREKISRIHFFLAFICLGGVFLIVPRFDLAESVYQGVLWGLLSGASFSLLTIANRKLTGRYSSFVIAFYEDGFAALLLLPFLFRYSAALDLRSIALLMALGIVCTAGSHTLFIHGMRWIDARTASIISTLEPIYGIGLAFFLLGEVPKLRTLAGGAVILAAVLFISAWEGLKSR